MSLTIGTTVHKKAINDFLVRAMKGEEESFCIQDACMDTVSERGLNCIRGVRIPEVEKLSGKEKSALREKIEDVILNSEITDVEIYEGDWNEPTQDVDVIFNADLKELIKEVSKKEKTSPFIEKD